MKKHIVILAAVCLSASLAGCESFLDEQPVSEVPAGSMWQTSRDAKAGVSQIYGFFRTAMRENYFYWGEFRSDNLSPGASSA
ncbi:MAG: RagB/SusD family nutrient uptake outer membrane protein, partial [Alistipes sp.]|nr:RagB/SusD family nutrient uptake outer membrane protein [Alistipes sp.]